MNIYGVIVDGIGESGMILFKLCIYTVFSNQAIAASKLAGYLIFSSDPKGILHYLAPIAKVFTSYVKSEVFKHRYQLIRNPYKSIPNCVYNEHSTARNSPFFRIGLEESISNLQPIPRLDVGIELSYFVLGNIELGFQLQEMSHQRETGGPKCDCLLEPNWLSYDSEVKLITLLPGKIYNHHTVILKAGSKDRQN